MIIYPILLLLTILIVVLLDGQDRLKKLNQSLR